MNLKTCFFKTNLNMKIDTDNKNNNSLNKP